MSLVSLQNILVGFGGPALLDNITLSIDEGERVCMLGRNGVGKSTVLRVISGAIVPDAGTVAFRQGARIAMLEQEVPPTLAGTVFDVIAGALGEQGRLLTEYHDLAGRVANEPGLLPRLEDVQHRIDAVSGWTMQQTIETILSRLQLHADLPFDQLSGGLKRRVLLGRALAGEPDLLLLDEPTNHLDIDAIGWLEQFLLDYRGAILFVTHDRMLLRRLATRIIDLDRGRATSWPGNYQTYLERKQAALDAEAVEQAKFDKKLASEEVWIRQGIKARRTRNEGRVRALKELRRIRSERREVIGNATMQIQEAERSGKLVIEAIDASFTYSDRPVVSHLTTTVLRGDRVGIIGPNGSGKTTLLKLLLGELLPASGTIKRGTNVEVIYLDQHRAQLDDEKSVQDNVANGSDYVTIGGIRRHVIGYLQDFLFAPDRCRGPVKVLSGGERNRLLLAQLFARPSNVLVLDEPTNDLDLETLELLEELLMEYSGTVLIVSHDREFVNNAVTSTLVLEGNGVVGEYVGGYDDWIERRNASLAAPLSAQTEKKQASRPQRERPRKLSFKEQKELDTLPGRIEALETEQQQLITTLSDPKMYRDGGAEVTAMKSRLGIVEAELVGAYDRWQELEALAG